MLGRKRRDRPRTMDELLRHAQASMPSGDPRPTPGAAQTSSIAPPSRPSTSHPSPSTSGLRPSPPGETEPLVAALPLIDRPSPSTSVGPSASTASAAPSRFASSDTQTDFMSTGPSFSRGRGPARGIRTWNSGTLIDVEFDETYHPVGLHARQLISQLGHMVRDPYTFPLTTLDWEAFPVETLDRMWKQVKDNVRACPELFRPVCMSKCRKMWKDHKNKMKMQHWKPHQDAPDVLERVPKGVLLDQWTQLVRYWTSEEAKKEAATNARNRAMQGPAHRLGTRHITQVRHELRAEGGPVDRMSVWMHSRDPCHPEVATIFAQFQSGLEALPEEERSLPSRRDEIFHSVVGRDGHGYTLTYGTGIPRSHIARAESSGASSSQGLRLRTDAEVEELLQSMKAAIREEVTNELRAEMRAELRTELAELEARLSQSRGHIVLDPPPTTQAPDAGSSHRERHDSVGEGSHDPSGSTDPDQSYDKSSGASHDGTTQRASALAALSSAFNPSSGGKTSSKPSVSGQGSQRPAAVAALSSVLTAEQKKALAESVAARSSTDSPKNENDPPVAEDPQEDQGVNETVDGVGSVSESNEEVSATKDESESNESGNLPIFSYEQVKAKSTDPAPGIDYMKREACLSDEEFERVLEMTKEAFYAQPKWKRDMQKKKLDLF